MNTPFEIHFEVERNCELKCKHCSSHLIREYGERGYSFTHMAQLIQLLNNYSVYVFFTGGEPLLSEDIEDLIQHVHQQSVDTHIGLFTTGIIVGKGSMASISESRAIRMRELGLEMCYISIYSSEPSIHDAMTNIQLSYTLTYNAMMSLIRNSVDIRFNSVIFSQNESEIKGIIKYASDIGASEVRLLKLIKHGNAINNWDQLCLTKQDHIDILSDLFDKRSMFPRITISGHPHLAPCRPFITAKGCEAGIKLLYVTYLGDIYPCACTKNNVDYKICHISEVDKLKNYLYNIESTHRQHCMSTKEGFL